MHVFISIKYFSFGHKNDPILQKEQIFWISGLEMIKYNPT